MKLLWGGMIKTDGASVRAVHTPGHAYDDLCFFIEEDQTLFSGDNVMGIGSVIFNNLMTYMSSLRILEGLAPKKIFPGHGPIIDDAMGKIQEYVHHRTQRIKDIEKILLSEKPLTFEEIFQAAYRDTVIPEGLDAAARANAQNVLDYLRGNGRAEEKDGGWQLIDNDSKL